LSENVGRTQRSDLDKFDHNPTSRWWKKGRLEFWRSRLLAGVQPAAPDGEIMLGLSYFIKFYQLFIHESFFFPLEVPYFLGGKKTMFGCHSHEPWISSGRAPSWVKDSRCPLWHLGY